MKPEPKDFLRNTVADTDWCPDCLSDPERKVEDCQGCPVDVAIKAVLNGGER